MNINLTSAPAPGDTSPGDLYVDLASREMWLGVDVSVDEAGAVLLSDISAIQPAIDASLVEAKAYTDTGVATRAPSIHTHTASQITDFESAVEAVVGSGGGSFTRGMIMMFSGSLAEIGTGPLAGWALCDGTNGTPDLRDRFVLGAGNRATGITNPAASFTTADGGDHVHGINATAITIAQLPSHDHGTWTGGDDRDHEHYVNLNSGTESQAHNHNYNQPAMNIRADNSGDRAGPNTTFQTGAENQLHYHGVAGWTQQRNTGHLHQVAAQGSNQGHTHTMVGGSVHNHVITGAQMREALPYLTLAYIMKL